MAEYLHGAYGKQSVSSVRAATQSKSAPVYVGTAPVHMARGGADNHDKPVVVSSFDEARRLFGYSEDWAKYTLCEAMHVHFVVNGVGPIILINCLNVGSVKTEDPVTQTIKPVNGRITLTGAEDAILDTLEITGKVLNVDYTAEFVPGTGTIVIAEVTSGKLGTADLTITYGTVDASAVTEADIIGSSDGEGTNKGISTVADVYARTGYIPSLLLCPGFSESKLVHDEMLRISKKVNGHWDMFFYSDIPLLDGSDRMTLSKAVEWKNTNGYTAENEKVHFPKVFGTDSRIYHISVLAAANKQALDAGEDGIPFQSPSNTPIPIAQRLYFGEGAGDLWLDDLTINEKLNRNGIASAAYVGGRWVVWGAHTAQYSGTTADQINVAETNLMMLFYLTNDFQRRRATEIDKPMTRNRLSQIVSEETTRLDALLSTGALIFGEVFISDTASDRADMMNGDFTFHFSVTTTPLAKSMTALVSWTDAGFATYFMTGEGT